MPPPYRLPFTFPMWPELSQRLWKIEDGLTLLHEGQVRLMAIGADLKAELVTANQTTNEIANDLSEVIAKLQNSHDPEVQEALTQLRDFNARLKDVASQYTGEQPNPAGAV